MKNYFTLKNTDCINWSTFLLSVIGQYAHPYSEGQSPLLHASEERSGGVGRRAESRAGVKSLGLVILLF